MRYAEVNHYKIFCTLDYRLPVITNDYQWYTRVYSVYLLFSIFNYCVNIKNIKWYNVYCKYKTYTLLQIFIHTLNYLIENNFELFKNSINIFYLPWREVLYYRPSPISHISFIYYHFSSQWLRFSNLLYYEYHGFTVYREHMGKLPSTLRRHSPDTAVSRNI